MYDGPHMKQRFLVIGVGTAALALLVLLAAIFTFAAAPTSAAPGDVSISALSCDSSPEYVRITNYGGASQSLSGFHILSDPSQNYDLSTHVASIGASQTLEFQSGTGAADNPGAGIYKLTGAFIYRNSPDTTDYASLLRSDSTTNQVNCGTTPTVPPTASPTHSPTPTPGQSGTVTVTPTPTAAPTPTGSALPCGEERWSVKTLSDPDVGQVNFNPQDTTVDQLRALAKPGSLPPNNRIPPTEETTFRMTAQVLQMKLEDDHDIHLVIADLSDPTHTMIVEFPDVACEGAAQSAHKDQMAQARQQFVSLFGSPSASHFTGISGIVTLTGVAFFDFLHGQTGVAPNGIELHPVLSIAVATSPTATLTVTPTPTPTPNLCAAIGDVSIQCTPTTSPSPAMPEPGDVDCDGHTAVSDAVFLLGDLGGVRPIPSARPCNDGGATIDGRPARDDANCDGLVNVLDVLTILKSLAGLVQLPKHC